MGWKPLTWQDVVAVFVVIGMLIAAVFAWGGNIPAAYRSRGEVVFWCLLVVLVVLLAWSWRRTSRRDLEVDILARVFPADQIMQVGPMHIWLTMLVNEPWVRVLAVIQNTRDGVGKARLAFRPERRRVMQLAMSRGTFSTNVQMLECAIPASGFVIASCDLRLMPVAKPMELRLWLDGSASASGREVRFARRNAITKRTSGCLSAAALLGGMIVVGGGTFLRAKVSAFTEDAPPVLPPEGLGRWEIYTLEPTTADADEAAIAQVTRDLASAIVSP